MKEKLLNTYIPMDLRHALADGKKLSGWAEGSVLLVDIAGFTLLTETLVGALGTRRGAEELTGLLNQIYDALILQVHAYRGSVISFSGDGILCWFEDDMGERATTCALEMRSEVIPFADMQVTNGAHVSVTVKICVETGMVRRFQVGDPHIQRLDVVMGAPLERLAQAEQMAATGQIVLGPEAAEKLESRLGILEKQDSFVIVDALEDQPTPQPWPPLSTKEGLPVDDLHVYILSPIYERLVAGQGEFLAELRRGTMLFLGLGGLDYQNEGTDVLLDAYIRWVQTTLEHYDGYLLQITTGEKGSYLYIVFGLLRSHENDAERAVETALSLCKIPAEFHGIGPVQIGISQGRVRAGAYGSQMRRTYTAIGDEANVAARLMQAAAGGEVLCSERVYQATKQCWFHEPLPPVSVKGMSRPLNIYRPLTRIQGRPSLNQTQLIGRQAELVLLSAAWQRVLSSRRQVLFLEGQAGIGKSRLVAEVIRLADEYGADCFLGEAQSVAQRKPYHAWLQLLGAFFELDDGMNLSQKRERVLAEVQALDPVLIERAPLLNDILSLDIPENELTENFDARLRHDSLTALVVDLLNSKAEQRPLALVLEDAQWLDSLSWSLALTVAQALVTQPVLLLIAMRPLGERASKSYVLLNELSGVEKICLQAMSEEDILALAAARFGLPVQALPMDVIEFLLGRADGNPFFAEELAHTLLESGAIQIVGDSCVFQGDLASLRESLPDTVEGVVLARIDRLSPEAQLTVKVAAVIGRSFLFSTLHDVHPQAIIGKVLREQLDDLSQRDLTMLKSSARQALETDLIYLFKHIIIQQVAYNTLLYAQREELHRAVAEWYQKNYAQSLKPYYPLLVHHWYQAGDLAQERHYARLAGEQAAAQFANAEAITYLSRALELTSEDDLAECYVLRLIREDVYHLLGDRVSQSADLVALQDLAEVLDDDQRRAQVAFRQARQADKTSDFSTAISAAARAIRLAQSIGDVSIQIESFIVWGWSLLIQGESEGAESKFKQALSLSEETASRRLEADGLRGLGTLYMMLGEYTQAKSYYEQVLVIAEQVDIRKGKASVLSNLGYLHEHQGDLVTGKKYYQRALDLNTEIGDQRGAALVISNLGGVALDEGNYATAQSFFEQALAVRKAVQDREGEGITLHNLGTISLHLGDYLEAKRIYKDAFAILCECGAKIYQGEALAYLSLLYSHQGNYQAAQKASQRGLRIAEDVQDRSVQGFLLDTLGYALTGLGQLSQAAEAFQNALLIRKALNQPHLATQSQAGLVSVALHQNNLKQAVKYAVEILEYIQAHGLQGLPNPFHVYLNCYHALQANGDARAANCLQYAYEDLQKRAAQISDPKIRRIYLEKSVYHSEIIAAYQSKD